MWVGALLLETEPTSMSGKKLSLSATPEGCSINLFLSLVDILKKFSTNLDTLFYIDTWGIEEEKNNHVFCLKI